MAPPEQSTLALGPTVIEQVDDPLHFRLHESPHVPLHSFMFAQSSEQLAPHVELEMSHDCPDGHVHDAPEHFGGFVLELPQPTTSRNAHKTSFI